MKPPNHKYLFYTSANLLLFSSLQRYLKFILNLELNQKKETSSLSSQTLLVYHQEKENPELLNIMANNKNIKIILLGLDINCTINLLDFTNLKNNFISKLSEDSSTTTQLFTEDELKQKLKNFFHSHGGDSLFEYLNYVTYYFREGPMQFIYDNISCQDYKEKFLMIGLKNWKKFKTNYDNYKYFIKIYELPIKAEELEINILNAEKMIKKISDMSEQELLKENQKIFLDLVETLNKLNDILTSIFRNLSLGQHGLQNPISR